MYFLISSDIASIVILFVSVAKKKRYRDIEKVVPETKIERVFKILKGLSE